MMVHLSDRDRALIAEGFARLHLLLVQLAGIPEADGIDATNDFHARLLAAGERAADRLSAVARAQAGLKELERRLYPDRAAPPTPAVRPGSDREPA